MHLVRILAIVPLALMSLFNIGYSFGTHPEPDVAPAMAAALLGLAGVVAALGLARNTTWGIPAALAVAGVNVVGAIIALVTGGEGAVLGLGVSSVALVLAFVVGSTGRRAAYEQSTSPSTAVSTTRRTR
jgi:hypothetical protein